MTAAVPRAACERERVDMLGLRIDRISESQTIDRAIGGVRDGHGGWICPANLDVLRQAADAPELRALVDGADLVVADGMPLLWASRLQGRALPERVAGSSLIHTLSAAAARRGASVFLLGGSPGVAERTAARLRADSPGIAIAGTHCPPVGFERDEEERKRLDAALRATRPDIAFVALGFPKQERLIAELRVRFPSIWFVSVGASFSLACGELQRAPRWMQRTGLEWLHRLAQEPRRLARRYLVEGIPFLLRVLAHSAARRGEADTAVGA